MDTVDTLEGLRLTDGVGREAHPGELGPVGGRPGGVETVYTKVAKDNKIVSKEKYRVRKVLPRFSMTYAQLLGCKELSRFNMNCAQLLGCKVLSRFNMSCAQLLGCKVLSRFNMTCAQLLASYK